MLPAVLILAGVALTYQAPEHSPVLQGSTQCVHVCVRARHRAVEHISTTATPPVVNNRPCCAVMDAASHQPTWSRSSALMRPYFHLNSRLSRARPRTSAEGWPAAQDTREVLELAALGVALQTSQSPLTQLLCNIVHRPGFMLGGLSQQVAVDQQLGLYCCCCCCCCWHHPFVNVLGLCDTGLDACCRSCLNNIVQTRNGF